MRARRWVGAVLALPLFAATLAATSPEQARADTTSQLKNIKAGTPDRAPAVAKKKTSSAVSASAPSEWRMQNRKTNGCAVEPPRFRSFGDPAVLRHCDRVDKRQWRFHTLFRTKRGYPVVQIQNQHSGYCLGVSRKRSGAVVRNKHCVHPTGGRLKRTKWRVANLENWGEMALYNRWSHKCLSIKRRTNVGRRLGQHYCDHTQPRMRWVGFFPAIN